MKKKTLVMAVVCALSTAAASIAAVGTGDIVFTGIKTNGTPDSWSMVALKSIGSGERIYFTDNGWRTAGGFNGALANDYDGTEGLNYLTTTAVISAGTIISPTVAGSFTLSSISQNGTINSITGAPILAFANSGDQLYAFASTSSLPTAGNPLNTQSTMTHLSAISTANAWSNAVDSNTGDLPSTLSATNGTSYRNNAVQNGSNYFDVTKSLNPSAGRTPALWGAMIADSANWSTATVATFALPTTAFNMASGVDIVWDANGSTSGTGGTGTWDATTASRFKNDVGDAGVAYHCWVDSVTGSSQTAVFAGTAGTVSVASSGVTASGIRFDATGYLVQSNKITLAGTSPTVSVTNSGDTGTISSEVAGTGGLKKSGSGTLILSGANAYTGDTNVTAGTLSLATTGSITSDVSLTGGALFVNGTVIGSVFADPGTTVSGDGTITDVSLIEGNLSPGNSPGSLDFASDLELAITTHTTMEIAADNTFDEINVGGAISYDGSLSIPISGTHADGESFDLFDFGTLAAGSDFDAVALTGSYAGSLLPTGGGTWAATLGGLVFTFTGSDGILSLSTQAVPEPLTAAGVILLASRVLGRRARVSL